MYHEWDLAEIAELLDERPDLFEQNADGRWVLSSWAQFIQDFGVFGRLESTTH